MSVNSSKSAISGLSAQHQFAQLLCAWRTHPVAVHFMRALPVQEPVEQLTHIHLQALPHDHKIDVPLQMHFTRSTQALYLSHKNMLLPPLSAAAPFGPALWQHLFTHVCTHVMCATHATHHLARIHFQSATQYALFDPQQPQLGAHLLSHFIDGQALGFESDATQQYVLQQLEAAKSSLITNTLLGLQSLRPNYLSISLSLDPSFSTHALHPTGALPLVHQVHQKIVQLGSQVLTHYQNTHAPMNLALLTPEVIQSLTPLGLDTDTLEKLYAQFEDFSSVLQHPGLYFDTLLVPTLQVHDRAPEALHYLLFLHALMLTSSVLLYLAQHQQQDASEPMLCFAHPLHMDQVCATLNLAPLSISKPKEHQIGVIGNAHWHMQRGKSLSAGTQTDVQVKINPSALLFMDFINTVTGSGFAKEHP